MGKGKTTCNAPMSLLDAVLVGTLEDIEFAEMRIRWAPLLEQQLSELLEQAALPGEYGKLAEETASQLVDLYRSGGQPQWWMHDFRGQLRLQLGELLSGQEKVLGAIKMISSPDLDLESQEKALKKFQEESSLIPGLPTLPVDRSRCRNALVALYYRQHRFEEAAEVLQQEIEDPEARSSQKDLALTKLEILKETPEPIGWEEETIPPDLREVRPEFFQGLITEGAGDGAGRIGAAYLAAELARRGYDEEALRVCDQMDQNQWEEKDAVHDASQVRGSVLDILGRSDQFTEGGDYAHRQRFQRLDSMADRLEKAGRKEESLSMRTKANQASWKVVQASDSVYYGGREYALEKKRHLDRFIKQKNFQEGLELASAEDPRDRISAAERRIVVLTAAAEFSPQQWLSELKKQLEHPDIISGAQKEGSGPKARTKAMMAVSQLEELGH